MIVYQPIDDDPPTVSKHGSTFNEAEDRQKQYPFQLCPECMSEHTEVVEMLKSDPDKFSTGFRRRFKHGIFMYECERVNYIYRDCECEFYQWYRTGEKQSVEVNNNIAWAIIGFILTALSIFMLITSSSVDDPPIWMAAVTCVSAELATIFGFMVGWALGEIFK